MSDPIEPAVSLAQKNRRLVAYMLGVAVAMLVFVFFGLVPLYNLICDITGLTGRTTQTSQAATDLIDESRAIKVQFLAIHNDGMPWEFRPQVHQVSVHPGAITPITFYARNPTATAMVAQAVPSLSPYESTVYFHKTQCFCFDQQTLAAGEEAQLGLVFQIDPELPKQITTITLAYTLFDITQTATQQPAMDRVATPFIDSHPGVLNRI